MSPNPSAIHRIAALNGASELCTPPSLGCLQYTPKHAVNSEAKIHEQAHSLTKAESQIGQDIHVAFADQDLHQWAIVPDHNQNRIPRHVIFNDYVSGQCGFLNKAATGGNLFFVVEDKPDEVQQKLRRKNLCAFGWIVRGGNLNQIDANDVTTFA